MTVYGAVQQLAFVETYMAGGVATVRDSFRVTPSFGAVYYQSLDLGFPDVRASVQTNPSSDGTYDETQFTGARTTTVSGTILQNGYQSAPVVSGWDPRVGWNSASWFIRYLSSWASPARRWRLYFMDDSGVPRFVDVRGEGFTAPIDKASGNARAWQMNLVNPSGKIYTLATGDGSTGDGRWRRRIRQSSVEFPGRAYPEPGPYVRNYPAPPPGVDSVGYGGSVATGFLANVHTGSAPMTDPRITVVSPSGLTQTIGITGYTIPANTVVHFDTTERTITTSAGQDLDQFKTAPLQWPQLYPGFSPGMASGGNAVGLSVGSSAADAYVEVLWYDADLL